ncbi:hypothetical protein [Oceanospirillum sanctuarii]|uniref:hypothetical protein n=1 Tax=Oceanospirillum sanctuarii TaxID=1434821 RepID=UPI001C3E13BE|nr:hypothetical protein [Oceanospirillum sanctuarii]
MENVWFFIIFAVVIVVLFDFTNGFHDASNMVASVIASRAMTPAQSVLIVGSFTFSARFWGAQQLPIPSVSLSLWMTYPLNSH